MEHASDTIVVWDTEFTSWERCIEDGWNEAEGQYKELIQIAGIKLTTDTLAQVDSFDVIIRPRINTTLSEHIIELTGITQEQVEETGVDVDAALTRFEEWAADAPRFSWGDDSDILQYNIDLYDLRYNIDNSYYFDIRPVFAAHGIPTSKYASGTLYTHFNVEAEIDQHYALDDARSLALSLRELN